MLKLFFREDSGDIQFFIPSLSISLKVPNFHPKPKPKYRAQTRTIWYMWWFRWEAQQIWRLKLPGRTGKSCSITEL